MVLLLVSLGCWYVVVFSALTDEAYAKRTTLTTALSTAEGDTDIAECASRAGRECRVDRGQCRLPRWD